MIARRVALSAIAGALSLVATPTIHAQRARPRVGIVLLSTVPGYVEAFTERFEALGWLIGSNVDLLMANAEGNFAALEQMTADLLSRSPDVIVTAAPRTLLQLRAATATLPIVAVGTIDPVRLGLSDSLARPSRNFTGSIGFIGELMGKRVELLREAIPTARRIGLLLNPGAPAFPETHARTLLNAEKLGATIVVLGFSSGPEVMQAVERARDEALDGVIVLPDALAIPQMAHIINRLDQLGVPSLCFEATDLRHGATFVLGGDRVALWRDAAERVDRLLRGAPIANLPFWQPTKVFMAVNLRAARRLGIEPPLSLLARADEVIE